MNQWECALFHFEFRSIFGKTCRPPAKNWALLKSMRSQTAKAGGKMSVPDFGSYTDPGKYNATRSWAFNFIFISFKHLKEKGGKFDWGTLLIWMSAKKFLNQFQFKKGNRNLMKRVRYWNSDLNALRWICGEIDWQTYL